MRLVNIQRAGRAEIGLYHQGQIVSLSDISGVEKEPCPTQMNDLLAHLQLFESLIRNWNKKLCAGAYAEFALEASKTELLAPVPAPASCRDGYAFRQHVAAARRNRGVEMIPEFDEYPIFYFTNHHAIYGPGKILCMADHFQQLDFELEAAIVIGRKGRNITAAQADEYIFGYMVMNDISARVLQMEEMKLNLGPAKGKDFATSIGPWLVTRDELQPFLVSPKTGHVGETFNLAMTARVNGKQVSSGNLSEMDWTFAEIIERVSYGVTIRPSEIIGSGTVGTGCFLELNGTAKRMNPENFQPQWLKPGDMVELEIAELGILQNTFELESDYSILALKKKAPAAN